MDEPRARKVLNHISNIYDRCEHSIKQVSECPIVVMVLPWVARGASVRLLRSKGPTGEVLSRRVNETIASFNAYKLKAWCEAQIQAYRYYLEGGEKEHE